MIHRRRIPLAILLLAITASTPTGTIRADEPATVRVAVFDLRCVGLPDELGDAALAEIRAALAGGNGFQLLTRDPAALKRMTDEMELGMSGLVDEDTAAEAGRILGATHALVGDLRRIEDAYRLHCALIDVATSAVVLASERSHASLLTAAQETGREIRTGLEFAPVEDDEAAAWSRAVYRASSERTPAADGTSYRVENAFDGDEGTCWQAADGNARGWIEILLPGPVTVGELSFSVRSGRLNRGVPKEFHLEYHRDGRWRTAARDLANMSDHPHVYLDEPVRARRWRLRVESVIGPGVAVKIDEIRMNR